MTAPPEEARSWAARCAEATRPAMPESAAWDQIARAGQEWDPPASPWDGPAMTPGMCFTNAAEVAFTTPGCEYAEGFAEGALGLWYHHAWVITPGGLVADPTWDVPGTRYVGMTFPSMPRVLGRCQLTAKPAGFGWGPAMADGSMATVS